MSLKLDLTLELVHLAGDNVHFRSPETNNSATVVIGVEQWKYMDKPVVITALLEKL